MQGRSACIISVGMHDCICIHHPPTEEFEDVQLPCRLAGPHVYPMILQMPCVCVIRPEIGSHYKDGKAVRIQLIYIRRRCLAVRDVCKNQKRQRKRKMLFNLIVE